jgi:SAM-dependent methyltransferase
MSHSDVEAQSQAEADRIRRVFAARDARRGRGHAISEAYRLVNEDRMIRMRDLVGRLVPTPYPTILDVGCGGGYDLASWHSAGWPSDRLAGVDLVDDRIAAARDRCPGVDLRVTDGTGLPFVDGAFDVVTAVTVFSSILDPTARRALFAEMWRVARPDGFLILYDFVIRNPRNRDVRPMRLRDLHDLGGRPSGSFRVTPLLYVVAAGAAVHPMLARLAMRLAPPTHRITYWRRPPVTSSR